MSQLVSKVRQSMKSLINAAKNLKTSRDADIFDEIAFTFDKTEVNLSNRQIGNFTVQYLVSPNPVTGNTAPSITYDEIVSEFETQVATVFRDAGLVLINYSYEQSDIVTDPTSGSVSLAFSINILVAEKIR